MRDFRDLRKGEATGGLAEISQERKAKRKWQCQCGKQSTRKRFIDGKRVVICATCEEAYRVSRLPLKIRTPFLR